MTSTRPVELSVEWQGEQRIRVRSADAEMTLDGEAAAGPSPVQVVAFGLAACMSIDVVHILTKGRLEVKGLTARLRGERADQDPRRFLGFSLHFEVRGAIPADKVDRALQLSRDKYCSVWQSLRQDISLETTFEIAP
jgi:putative redox protein